MSSGSGSYDLLLIIPSGLTYAMGGRSRCAIDGPIAPSASPSALGPAPGAGPTWLGGAAVGSGDIGTGSMSGLLQLSAAVASSSDCSLSPSDVRVYGVYGLAYPYISFSLLLYFDP